MWRIGGGSEPTAERCASEVSCRVSVRRRGAFLAITLMVTYRNCIIALSEEENGGEDMNKSLRLRCVPVTTAQSGRVHVATIFEDAERGIIRSEAAELLAATTASATTEPG